MNEMLQFKQLKYTARKLDCIHFHGFLFKAYRIFVNKKEY